jgi:hypothetical protein
MQNYFSVSIQLKLNQKRHQFIYIIKSLILFLFFSKIEKKRLDRFKEQQYTYTHYKCVDVSNCEIKHIEINKESESI